MFRSLAATVMLAALVTPALADAPTPFADAACPQANDSGKKLNALSATGKASSDDLMAAAQGLVDGYRDCVSSFDHIQNGKNIDHQSDYIAVHRLYSRLQLARSLQRVGSFEEQLHEPGRARVDYSGALVQLEEMTQILADSTVGPVDKDTPEGHLKAESFALRAEIVAAEAKLPAPTVTAPSK